MSIKTSKRIALGVITALVFAPFAAIAPANAAAVNATTAAVASINLTKATASVDAVGQTVRVFFGADFDATSAAGAGDNYNLVFRASLTSFPTGGNVAVAGDKDLPATPVAVPGANATPRSESGNSVTVALANAADTPNETIASSGTSGLGNFTFSPGVAGSHVLTVWFDANNDGIFSTGEAFQTITISVVTAAANATDFPDTDYVNTAANDDLYVSSVGGTVVSNGRVGVPVGFSPNYTLTNKINTTTASGTAIDVTTGSKRAKLVYTVANPSGTAVTTYSSETSRLAASADSGVQFVAPLQANNVAAGTNTNLADGLAQFKPNSGATSWFTPTVAGTYVVTVYHDAIRNDLRNAFEAVATFNIDVVVDALPSITFTKFGSNPTVTQSADGGYGQLVKVSLTSGSSPVSLAPTETLVLTGPTGTVFDMISTCDASGCSMGDGSNGVTQNLTRTHFSGNGEAWINVGNETAGGGSYAITALIQGGTAAGASGSFGLTIQTRNTLLEPTVDLDNVNTDAGVFGADIANNNAVNWDVKTGTATTVSAKMVIADTAGNHNKIVTARWTDTAGLITGIRGAIYNINMLTPLAAADLTATTSVTFAVAIPATTAGLATTTALGILVASPAGGAAARTANIRNATAVNTTIAVDPSSLTATSYSIRAAAASANTFTALIIDQFGSPMASQAMTARVTGRNQQAVATPLVSDANGKVSFTVTDTYTGTLLLSDTLTFTATSGNAAARAVTINYATYLPTATVTVTGGASEDIAPAVTYNRINAGATGADATLVTITATLKDANGATLPAGIPVAWTISGLDGKSAIYADPDTGYDWKTSMTDSTGKAITHVYAWAVGAVTVTATNNAIVGTGKINFANVADGSSARVVSATAAGNVVTAKVVDRYGNGVAGVSITATRTAGTGYFGGNSASSAVAETGENGTVDFVIVGGGATVSVKTTTLNFGQTSSAAGKVGATTITAGSVGESLSPAGVQTATATVAAPAVVVPPVVYDNPTLSFVKSAGRVILSGTAVDGEGDIIIYTKRVGTTAWKERAKTLEVAAPGDFNGSIRAPKNNVLIRVKQEGTGQFSNQVIVVK